MYFSGTQRFADPSFLVTGKEGEGIGSNDFGIEDGIAYSATGTDVCSDVFHDWEWLKVKGEKSEK